ILSGTLSAGKSFERDIGHGLIFRLVPSPASYGKGWDIEIRPKGDPAGGFDEYASVATPPYHLYKPTYLNASYGVTAQKAVAMSPRKFQFVDTPQDSQAASVVVNTVVYTVDWPSHEDSLAAAAAKIPVASVNCAYWIPASRQEKITKTSAQSTGSNSRSASGSIPARISNKCCSPGMLTESFLLYRFVKSGHSLQFGEGCSTCSTTRTSTAALVDSRRRPS